MAQSAQRIITRTMRGLKYLGRTANPTADDSADAFDTLQEMLAGWNREGLLLPYVLIQAITLVINQATYTIGSGGDVAITRPDKIKAASYRYGTTPNFVEVTCDVIESELEWQRVKSKALSTSVVSKVFYNPKFPLGELNAYPVPSVAGTLLIYVQDRLVQLTDLSTEFALPDGFLQAIRFNLGVKLQPELGLDLPKGWLDQARDTKAAIKSSNIKHGKLSLNGVPGTSSSGGGYWIYTDTY